MTYFETPATYPDNPPLLSFPAAHDTVETSALRRQIPALLLQLIAMFTLSGIKRGALTHMSRIKQKLVRLHKAERENYAAWLKRALRSDPVWQYQVREDLGGLQALRRWDLRYARMQAGEPASRGRTNTPAQKREVGKYQPRVDRDGLFRLAKIDRPDNPAQSAPRPAGPHINIRMAMAALDAPGAIPVTPSDLRPNYVVEALGANEPCVKRLDVQSIWGGIYGQHMDWNGVLLLADMAFMRDDWRKEFVLEYRGDPEPP